MIKEKAQNANWFAACNVDDVPSDGGVCVKYMSEQIALFRFERRNEWHASQNKCPHRQQMAISRGMLGSANGEAKIACPFHKKTFSLIDGRCLNSDEALQIAIYPVKVENNIVYIDVSSIEIKDNHNAYEKCNF
ncbi:MAG: nitrite reductase small subunit NirD [Chitinophagaceae bacterium]|nr:nitrite reductase small subunit NirD [Chitinophagaceae bacterium]